MAEGINELAAALARAQMDLEGASKDRTNPHFKSQYATLESVLEAWYAVGPRNGLAVTQILVDAGDRQGILLRTVLMHSSGQAVDSLFFMPVPKPDPQGYGSAITYARRYTLMALVGIAPVDDDAESAMPQRNGSRPSPTQQDDIKFSLLVQKFTGSAADKTRLGLQIAESGLSKERRGELLKVLENKGLSVGA